MKEKLELVTEFGSLRAGMIVVSKPCGWCGGSHRMMLVRLLQKTYVRRPNGEWVEAINAWMPAPKPNCFDLLSAMSVVKRSLYRVIDGLSQTSEERKAVTA